MEKQKKANKVIGHKRPFRFVCAIAASRSQICENVFVLFLRFTYWELGLLVISRWLLRVSCVRSIARTRGKKAALRSLWWPFGVFGGVVMAYSEATTQNGIHAFGNTSAIRAFNHIIFTGWLNRAKHLKLNQFVETHSSVVGRALNGFLLHIFSAIIPFKIENNNKYIHLCAMRASVCVCARSRTASRQRSCVCVAVSVRDGILRSVHSLYDSLNWFKLVSTRINSYCEPEHTVHHHNHDDNYDDDDAASK